MSAVKVLIVDDSPVIREQMLNWLGGEPDIEVLGIADGKDNAAEKLASLKPDIITLNLKSKHNYAEFIKAITSHSSLPVVVITETDIKSLDGVKAGTVAFVKIPLIRTRSTMESFAQRLVQQIKDSAGKKSGAVPVPPSQVKKVPPKAAEPVEVKKSPEAVPEAAPKAESIFGVKPAPTPKPSFTPTPVTKQPVPEPKPAPAVKPPVPELKPAPAVKPPVPELKPAPAVKPPVPEPKPAPAVKPPVPELKPAPAAKAEPDIKATRPTAEAAASIPKANPIDQSDPAAKALAAAAAAKQKLVGSPSPRGRRHVIALGASTGGTDALHEVLHNLPVDTPGIVIVQHMPELFTKMYADRLNRACKMSCVEAVDGERVEVGKIILAAGNYHMRLARDSRGYYVTSQKGEKVSGHCPSVDVLFESVAKVAGSDAIGAIFTGMGADGAIGLKKMRDAGAYTIGQDEKTCVVYGMPMVAYNMGGVCRQAPLDQIANIILENC